MGNVIIGQSGGPTAVINASLAGAIKAAKVNGIEKVYGMRHGIEGFLKDEVILLDDYFQDMNDLSLLKRTPGAFLGSCRFKLPKVKGNENVYARLFELLEKYDIEYFLYNGGNDSMDTTLQLSQYAAAHGSNVKFMGIPKTIDNDLPVTDHTPGYGSASKYIATTMKEIIRDNESFGDTYPYIAIVEIMGRNAGWLTAASALSKAADCTGPDLIYLPESAFSVSDFTARVKDLCQYKSSIVIAISEGIRTSDGTLVCEQSGSRGFTDSFGHKALSGAGKVLADHLALETGCKTRAIEFSILQRCASHLSSRTDVNEAYDCGYKACMAALQGETGKMITIRVPEREPYVVNYDITDVKKIANKEKMFPQEWITNQGTYISEEYLRYARPFVIGDVSPYFSGGVPKHATLSANTNFLRSDKLGYKDE